MMRPRWSVGLGSALALLFVLSCVPATTAPAAAPSVSQGPAPADSASASLAPELQALVAAARREEALNLVWSDGALGSSDGVSRLAREFNRHYGLNLDVRFTPGPSIPEMAAKLAQEARSGRVASSEVFLGGVTQITTLMNENAGEPNDWARVSLGRAELGYTVP
jgi:hypothetical protein